MSQNNHLLKRAHKKMDYELLLWRKKIVHNLRFARRQNLPRNVVFVAGVQRSGTNMLMDTLERHWQTDVYHERDPRAYDDYQMRSYKQIRALIDASKAPIIIFKALCESHDLSQLLDHFEPAKAIWLLRSFEDAVNSHIVLWNDMPDLIGEFVRKGQSGTWHCRGISGETLRIVKQCYHAKISNASAVALFWYFRNQLFFDQDMHNSARVHLARYETLVSNPDIAFEGLFRFLGSQYTSRLASRVSAKSIRKKPPPDIEPEIVAICEKLTQRFDAILKPEGISGS